ncbi:Homeobox protein BEL1 like [Apostasia shenzhenica]|uniref:Homeobox protein BEL1 like n=1 Tax=Apostasia shenzhenica TaxID=1088818 RepID=A0A2I0AXZ7_9ASPA|nr:Homeobox protein BEL1 like [Apostasia shenzhenica]
MASQETHHPAALGYSDFAAAAAGEGYEEAAGHELYSLQTRMEMLGFLSKHNPNSSWRGSPAADPVLIAGEGSWEQPRQLLVDDDSVRCLFPVNGDEPQCQGLSLSLYNSEPTGGAAASGVEFQQNYSFSAPSAGHKLRSSKYLIPAQELLNEFCDLGGARAASKQKTKNRRWEEGGSSSSSPINLSLQTLDILELQKRKANLLSLLEEVDRRYRKYCEQMRAVAAAFEAVAGQGAAATYLALASKAMSRHFRCLRDGIAGQIQATKKATGDRDPIALQGISTGETPRLKLLDQSFRQQKAFQQSGGILEPHPWRPQRGLPERSVSILRAWLFEHFLHPYPSDVDKHILARQTGLSRSQVSNWFINARVRLWKPMIEEMYVEETKEHEEDEEVDRNPNPNPNSSFSIDRTAEQKPLPGDLFSDPESLSSIINAGAGHHPGRREENFGTVDIDFSSFNGCRNGGNGVTLTLGLQQHAGGGGSGGMGFSLSAANQPPLYYRGQTPEECQPVQFSVIDGEVQALPYRNLMGAQLLHDLAG